MYYRMQGMMAALVVGIGCICMTACDNGTKDVENANSVNETTAVSTETTEHTSEMDTVQTTVTTTTSDSTTTCSTETSAAETTTIAQSTAETSQTTELQQESADLSGYYGYWYISDTTYENELQIHESEAGSICFSLFYYRIAEIGPVTAQPDGNTAHFVNDEIEGYLLFEDERISVCITKSNVPFVEAETCTYDVQFEESHLNSGF